MHPLAERILEGEVLCEGEILAYNARSVLARDRARKQHAHDPADCKNKHCTHGIGDDTDFAVLLAEQAIEACTCDPPQAH